MITRAHILMTNFETLLPEDGAASPWLFGLKQPSALDAHLLVFIARMKDIGKEAIITDALMKYAEVAMETKEWKDVMQGSRTVPVR